MGVLRCDREGCRNIMCDRLLQFERGRMYICHDCFEQLEGLSKSWPWTLMRHELEERIRDFMDTEYVPPEPALDKPNWLRDWYEITRDPQHRPED